MKFWKDARAAYLAVQPPEELEEAVRAGIRTAEAKGAGAAGNPGR